MGEKCNHLISRPDIVGIDEFSAGENEETFLECLRPSDHVGPHLVKRTDRIGGQFIIWEDDPCDFGTCTYCDREDPEDNCLIFMEVSKEDADRLRASADVGGE